MAISRYTKDSIIQNRRGYALLATNGTIVKVRDAVASGDIPSQEKILTSTTRLDILAHHQYGDGRLWWVIAAASGIGWWLQVPSGTRLLIPVSFADVENFI
jgi:hypothetical protein|tara:strand:- start:504 stop:806 length:303 start_codon:yes stop_codon:yes gene_type:complete